MDAELTAREGSPVGSELEVQLLDTMSTAPSRQWRVGDLCRVLDGADVLDALVAIDRLNRSGRVVRIAAGRYRMR